MLVIVFLGLLAVALSDDASFTTQLFKLIDVDQDGVIRPSEMIAGYSNDDLNKDGLMTYEEFAAGAHPGSPPLSVEEAFDFWDSIDIEKNNEIDSTCPVVFFYLMDTNKDDEIKPEEFKENYLPVIYSLSKEHGDSKEKA
ncbi:hypothetical protein C0Q70_13018 [Pomacea canaliculata]|uniref:EF-hand domain-containing protein n=1 Tax=Pomacea canaliculata TaxID=400727 RepID=A0A2T7P373_POMCA|nr:hypothetical protein C0Q70_13018 [Pomacea canaliculata]